MRAHIVIPDTQVKPGVPVDQLGWIGQYIVDKFYGKNVAIIHLGDHWDMPSLSSYDKGKKSMEGRRVVSDLIAGNTGFALLDEPIVRAKAKQAAEQKKHKKKIQTWEPELHFLFGNHENRVVRAVEDDAQIEGLLSLDYMDTRGWQRHEFLEVVNIDGVNYSHYFINRMTGRPLGGQNLDTRLKTIGASFTMGHQQGLWTANRMVMGKMQRGLVAGSAYLHEEDYLGPQGNDHWRGIVVCHDVHDGSYDLMEVSLDYLCRRYEGVSLKTFMGE